MDEMIDRLTEDMKLTELDKVRLGRLLIKKRYHRIFNTGIAGTVEFKAVKRA